MGVSWSTPLLIRLTPGKETRFPLYRRTGAENLASTGMRSSDRPTRNQSLCRLRYHGPPNNVEASINRSEVILLGN
jgi:hypothetical protein